MNFKICASPLESDSPGFWRVYLHFPAQRCRGFVIVFFEEFNIWYVIYVFLLHFDILKISALTVYIESLGVSRSNTNLY